MYLLVADSVLREVLDNEEEVEFAVFCGLLLFEDVELCDVPLVELDGWRLWDGHLLFVEPPPAHHGATHVVLLVSLAELVDELVRDLRAQGEDAVEELAVVVCVHLRDGLDHLVLHNVDQHLRLDRTNGEEEVQNVRQSVPPQVRQVARHSIRLIRAALTRRCIRHRLALPIQGEHYTVADDRSYTHMVLSKLLVGGPKLDEGLRHDEVACVAELLQRLRNLHELHL